MSPQVLAFAIPWPSRWVRQSQQDRPPTRLAVLPVILAKPTRGKRKAALFACLRREALLLHEAEQRLAGLEIPSREVVLSRSFSQHIAEARAEVARRDETFRQLCAFGEEHGLLPDPNFWDSWPRASRSS